MSQTPEYIEGIRAHFPLLKTKVNGEPLVYFDNAATTQKPQRVIDRISEYYSGQNANIHRGVHHLSQIATQDYENARIRVKNYIGASRENEIVFTKGTTDGINLIASSLGELMTKGDEVLISAMEHHSNIVPWQLLAERTGIVLKIIPIHQDGTLNMACFEDMLNEKTKLVSISSTLF